MVTENEAFRRTFFGKFSVFRLYPVIYCEFLEYLFQTQILIFQELSNGVLTLQIGWVVIENEAFSRTFSRPTTQTVPVESVLARASPSLEQLMLLTLINYYSLSNACLLRHIYLVPHDIFDRIRVATKFTWKVFSVTSFEILVHRVFSEIAQHLPKTFSVLFSVVDAVNVSSPVNSSKKLNYCSFFLLQNYLGGGSDSMLEARAS